MSPVTVIRALLAAREAVRQAPAVLDELRSAARGVRRLLEALGVDMDGEPTHDEARHYCQRNDPPRDERAGGPGRPAARWDGRYCAKRRHLYPPQARPQG